MNWLEKARDFLNHRRLSYAKCFSGPPGQEVLADLARFCRANESTYHTDPRMHAVLEGRREVWLRIQSHLKLTEDELWQLYGQPRK